MSDSKYVIDPFKSRLSEENCGYCVLDFDARSQNVGVTATFAGWHHPCTECRRQAQ